MRQAPSPSKTQSLHHQPCLAHCVCLQPRGIHGEHSESDGGVYDLSNKERLGKSEVELVQTMIDGVNVLIAAEKALEAGTPLPSRLSK